MVRVIKRDNTVVDFDVNRIINAVMKAQGNLGCSNFDDALTLGMSVQAQFINEETVSIDKIQLATEDLLMELHPEVARKFIEYRSMRDREREKEINATPLWWS